MSKVIIGCDPDSYKSGFAKYQNGKLISVECMALVNAFYFFKAEQESCSELGIELELHIENVTGTSASFTAKDKRIPLAGKLKIARNIGQCEQAQIEIERIAKFFGIKVIRHGLSSVWKDSKTGKSALADLGWHGQSNEDSRSAAYFGYLGVKLDKTKNKP